LLPAIERSAAQAFRQYPELAWLADSEVMDETAHAGFMANAGSWVAVNGQDRPQGFICVSVQGKALHVHELSVCSEAQGQGLGRQLLQQVLAIAEDRGLKSVTLTTFAEVPWNAPFYARLGFEVLSSEALDGRLRQVLAEERAHGLKGRCAMRRVVGES